MYTALAANIFDIGSYLIHDGGLNTHVCNSKSAHLYVKTKDAQDDEYLNTGAGQIKIESWGRIETAFESPNGLISIFIENVAFVGSFSTSLVSQSILDRKGINFDTGGPQLYKDGITKYFLHCTNRHYTFTAAGPPHRHLQNTLEALTTTKTFLTAGLATPSVKSNNVAAAQAIKYNCATTTSSKKLANSMAFSHNPAVTTIKMPVDKMPPTATLAVTSSISVIFFTSRTSFISPTPPAFTSTTKKPSYAEVASQSSFKSPETPKSTPFTLTSTRCRTSSPIPWHAKPWTLIKPVLYMTMEDLFCKFAGKHLASLKLETFSPPRPVQTVTSSQLGRFFE